MNKITKLFAVALLFVVSPSLVNAMEAVEVKSGARIEAAAGLGASDDGVVEISRAEIWEQIAKAEKLLADRGSYDQKLAELIAALKRGAAAVEQVAVALKEEQVQRGGQ